MPGKREARRITPAIFIRQQVLCMLTTEFAKALGVDQSVISRYEQIGRIPKAHHKKILRLARDRRVRLRPEWFNSVPWDPKAGVPQ